MKWSRTEIDRLLPILEQISTHLAPVDGKNILVAGSAEGEVVFWLAEMMESGRVTGLETDPHALEISRRTARELGLETVVQFMPSGKDPTSLPDLSFDALVSELIVYPTSAPAEIGLPGMVRLLRPGGVMLLTDVILTMPLPDSVRRELSMIGLDHLNQAAPDDFTRGLKAAGMVNIELQDLTPTLRPLWQHRRAVDLSAAHWQAYSHLLEDSEYALGRSIFYIYVRADKVK